MARHCFDAGWIRRDQDDRSVAITAKGKRAFHANFGLTDLV